MVKNTKIEKGAIEERERLAAIAEMKFGALSDDEVLALLAERKHLEVLQSEYAAQKKKEEEKAQEQARIEEEHRKQQEEVVHKKEALAQAIATLNESLSPDKTDNELLTFIKQRKALEKELEALNSMSESSEPTLAVSIPQSAPLPPIESEQAAAIEDEPQNTAPAEVSLPDEIKIPISIAEKNGTESAVANFKQSLKEDFGTEGIQDNDIAQGSELYRYLEQLKNNVGSLSTFLQEMPAQAKKNKAFMLKVAEIDPAYAMHYADAVTLKRDEDFNIKIASMKNPRNSGNALAEMLPEVRTSKVILAGVKQDYRNIKFIQPNMEAYDEIMGIAKKATLTRLKELKEAADMMLIIPRLLQEDKLFMEEAKKVLSGKQEG